MAPGPHGILHQRICETVVEPRELVQLSAPKLSSEAAICQDPAEIREKLQEAIGLQGARKPDPTACTTMRPSARQTKFKVSHEHRARVGEQLVAEELHCMVGGATVVGDGMDVRDV